MLLSEKICLKEWHTRSFSVRKLLIRIRFVVASEYSGVWNWRIKGRWENGCTDYEKGENIKGFSRSGRRMQLKLFYFHQLICLCYWHDGVVLFFCYERSLFDRLFRHPLEVRHTTVNSAATIEYSVRDN